MSLDIRVCIIFIDAALGEELAVRAEIERKEPADLAGEFVARFMDAIQPADAEEPIGGGKTVGQKIQLTRETDRTVEQLSEERGIGIARFKRACIRKALAQPVNKLSLN